MKGNLIFVVVSVVVVGLGIGIYFAAPILQTDQEKVDRYVDRQVERARRLLDQFDQAQAQLTDIRDELKTRNVDIDLTPEQITKLLADKPKAGENINQYLEKLIAEAPYRDGLRKAGGRPSDASIGVNPDRQGSELSAAMQKIQKAFDANAKLLDEAHKVVTTAMAYQAGSATGGAHPAGNHLAGIILMRKSQIDFQRALRRRTIASNQIKQIRRVTQQIRKIQSNRPLFDHAGVDAQIEAIRETISNINKDIKQDQANTKQLETTIATIQKEIKVARQQADAARDKMEAILEKGYSVQDPNSYDAFAKAYGQQAALHATASQRADMLEFGTLQNARIDESGDYVKGKYVPTAGKRIEPSLGLSSYETRLRETQTMAQGRAKTIEALETQIENLGKIKADLAAGQDTADQLVQAHTDALKKAAEELGRYLGEAAGFEDTALELAQQASGKLSSAISTTNRKFGTQRWAGAEILAQRGDSYRLRGTILAQRILQLQLVAVIYEELQTLSIGEMDPRDTEVQIHEAVTQATEDLNRAQELYEQARTPLNSHFSVIANMGTVQLLLARVVGVDTDKGKIYLENAGRLFNAVAEKENPRAKEYLTAMARLVIKVSAPPPEATPSEEEEGEGEEAEPEEPEEDKEEAETDAEDEPASDEDEEAEEKADEEKSEA